MSVDGATSRSHEVGGTIGALTAREMGCHEKIRARECCGLTYDPA